MTHDEMTAYAVEQGWKPWGKPRALPGNDSKYLCYRRGNTYLWIGLRFIERVGYEVVDFHTMPEGARILVRSWE